MTDRENVVDKPVQYESRWESEKHHGEDDWQHVGHCRLFGIRRRYLLLKEHGNPHEDGEQAQVITYERQRERQFRQDIGCREVIYPEHKRRPAKFYGQSQHVK